VRVGVVRSEDRITLLYYAMRELFIRVRGIGILRTSPFGDSRK
jgi:hypothetical protein